MGRFDGPEYYLDDLEDSEEEVMKRAGGGKRRVPRKDHKFEERIQDIRRRIWRQERLLADIEAKHKALFPNAIHDHDQAGSLRVKCFGENDALTGKQVIKFHQVVADYLADLAAREAANAGRALSANAVKRAALATIKTAINNGNYA